MSTNSANNLERLLESMPTSHGEVDDIEMDNLMTAHDEVDDVEMDQPLPADMEPDDPIDVDDDDDDDDVDIPDLTSGISTTAQQITPTAFPHSYQVGEINESISDYPLKCLDEISFDEAPAPSQSAGSSQPVQHVAQAPPSAHQDVSPAPKSPSPLTPAPASPEETIQPLSTSHRAPPVTSKPEKQTKANPAAGKKPSTARARKVKDKKVKQAAAPAVRRSARLQARVAAQQAAASTVPTATHPVAPGQTGASGPTKGAQDANGASKGKGKPSRKVAPVIQAQTAPSPALKSDTVEKPAARPSAPTTKASQKRKPASKATRKESAGKKTSIARTAPGKEAKAKEAAVKEAARTERAARRATRGAKASEPEPEEPKTRGKGGRASTKVQEHVPGLDAAAKPADIIKRMTRSATRAAKETAPHPEPPKPTTGQAKATAARTAAAQGTSQSAPAPKSAPRKAKGTGKKTPAAATKQPASPRKSTGAKRGKALVDPSPAPSRRKPARKPPTKKATTLQTTTATQAPPAEAEEVRHSDIANADPVPPPPASSATLEPDHREQVAEGDSDDEEDALGPGTIGDVDNGVQAPGQQEEQEAQHHAMTEPVAPPYGGDWLDRLSYPPEESEHQLDDIETERPAQQSAPTWISAAASHGGPSWERLPIGPQQPHPWQWRHSRAEVIDSDDDIED